jgi:hypothetical protein
MSLRSTLSTQKILPNTGVREDRGSDVSEILRGKEDTFKFQK